MERVIIWTENNKGLIGNINGEALGIQSVTTDCGKNILVHKNKLYFPNHPKGYNQPCFRK